MPFLSNLASLWNLLLFLAVILILARFFYSVFLRKLLRARRISHIRDRRALNDASRRQN